jgi:DNA-binding MarR family transcriptional regulator
VEDDAAPQLAEMFTRLTKRVRRRQAQLLAPMGLTPAQARALRVIGHADQPLRMIDLAESLGIVPRSVTTVVDALERAGLVRRAIDPANRRSTLLALTDGGAAALGEMREARRQAAEELFAPLGAVQREQLRALLASLDTASLPR